MTTSVFITVDNTNIDRLVDIVSRYNIGTLVPDEIVINACSIIDEHSLSILKEIHELGCDNISIYACKTNRSEADNRNYTQKLTTGDIIMYHNPTTLPSVKRVEFVVEYFNNNDCYILNHTLYHHDMFIGDAVSFDTATVISASDLYTRYFPFKVLENAWNYTRTYGIELGARSLDQLSVCMKREVLNEFKWKNSYECTLYEGSGDGGMCYDFSLETLYKYKRSDIINAPLTIV